MKTSKRGGLALVAVLAAAVVALACAVVPLSARADDTSSYLNIDAENRTITVTDDSSVTSEIQDAINYISDNYSSSMQYDSLTGTGGWTIVVSAGTYSRFAIMHDYSNALNGLTVKAADGATVKIDVLDGSDAPKDSSGTSLLADSTNYPDMGGVQILAQYVTISGLTFVQESVTYTWGSWTGGRIIDTTCEHGARSEGLTVSNCTFEGSGTTCWGIFLNQINKATVTNCVFNNISKAIDFYGDNTYKTDFVMTGNTFNGGSFALHGYTNGGTIVFTGNTITGSSTLRCKVVIQDNSSANALTVTIEDNTLTNAMIGVVGLYGHALADVDDLLNANTFGDNSYVVSADYPYITIYAAPEDANGYWIVTGGDNSFTNGYQSTIEGLVSDTNDAGSNTLTITVDASQNFIETFTNCKYGIYWVGETGDDPDVEKAVTSESTLAAGDTASFSLTVSAPEYLGTWVSDGYDHASETEEGSYIVTVHDTMDAVLELDASSIEVSVNGVTIDSYRYTLTTSGLEDGCAFELSIDLVSLVEAGILVADEDGAYPDVVITYSATVSDDAEVGIYENTTWLAYETDTTEPSTVEVPVNEYVGVTVTKVWDDSEDADELRPDSVTVELCADGEATGLTVTLSETNDWTDTFEDLVAYVLDEDGTATEIAYTVVEVAVDGYATTVTGSASEGYVVTNTHTVTVPEYEPVTVSIAVEKAWDDDGDAEGLRPESVTVELYANGEATGETVVLSEVNGWYDAFSGLDAYDEDGDAIAYAIAEVGVPEGYAVSYSSFTYGLEEGIYSITVTNTLVEEVEDTESTDSTESTSDTTTSVPSTGDVTGTGYVALAAAAGVAAVAGALALRRRARR